MDNNKAVQFHKDLAGKFEICPKKIIKNKEDLSLAYTPGVAQACKKIANNKKESFNLTGRGNSLAIITDGSAVLGLGNIGPEAAMPVMEGKAILFKQLAGIDAYPICINTQDKNQIIEIVKNLAPTFGAINIEDISAPKCFEIEEKLQGLEIPVMHDDQHATAVVATAGILNALKVVNKQINQIKIVISGAGAAGTAIAKMLIQFNAADIIMCDRKGIIHRDRKDLDDNPHKKEIALATNKENQTGTLENALKNSDVFIGVSTGNILKKEWLKTMAEKPIIFALANPIPEISPEDAKAEGAFIVATGRSDYPNQINNILAFPGIFRGALNSKTSSITDAMKHAAVQAIVNYIKSPAVDFIIPDPLDTNIHKKIAAAVMEAAEK